MRALLICLSLGLSLAASAAEPPKFPADQLEFFEKQVRPLLAEHCHKCHGPDQQKGNLRLDSRAAAIQGGDSGPAIDLDTPTQSELLSAISYDPSGYQMPPDGKLSAEQIEVLSRWVELGAPWPAEFPEHASDAGQSWEQTFNERRLHWSFLPLTRPSVPTVSDPSWCRTPIDRFILSQLEAAQLPHAGEADRRTWLRRATLDVTGLPPTPEELAAFVADDAPDAWERVVERLLASPHLGERWGRHWLDLVRYAESRGHEFDYDVANPWPYRDFVIRALNEDVPYDRFVVEHIAGDLLSVECPVSSEKHGGPRSNSPDTQHSTLNSLRIDPATGSNESIVATGFWFLGEWVHSPVDIRQEEADRFENMIDVYSKTFLGLTVACARCHDHKFDPIPQTDFYALQGYLQSTTYQQVRYEHWENNRRVVRELRQLEQRAAEALLKVMAEIGEPVVEELDQYLLAASEALHTEETSAESAAARIQQAAANHHVNAEQLEHWCRHLRKAASDRHDPFSIWGRFATGQISDFNSARFRSDEELPENKTLGVLHDWLIAAHDQGRLFTADQFRGDELAFRPAINGAARLDLGSLPQRPLRQIQLADHVEFDTELGNLPVSPSSMRDAGSLVDPPRGSRTLCTPSFEIAHDRVWCEIRGGCKTYVVVDSHALIGGPLHGSLLADHKTPAENPDAWRWISHDVSRYRGSRAHLEFIPYKDERFSVRYVVLADSLPTSSQDSAANEIALTRWPNEATPAELASAYQRHWNLKDSVAWYFPPGGRASAFPTSTLQTAEWARLHPELFGLDTDDSRQRLAKVAKPFIDKRNELLAQLRRESGLAPVMLDGSGENEYVFIRGNWKKRGETVPRRFLSVFGGDQSGGARVQSQQGTASNAATLNTQHSTLNSPALDSGLSALDSPTGSGRLRLALQMVDPAQTPIVARVIVNRLWQHYFGRGLVLTPDDFGHLGTPPTHPELLDWLATELIAHDWSLKHIHRLILESATYRLGSSLSVEGGVLSAERPEQKAESPERSVQSTSGDGLGANALDSGLPALDPSTVDPTNTLLWRMNIKRLEGEIIRDSILSISGRLDDGLYGPSVPVHLTSFLEGRGRPGVSGPVDGAGRRSLYIAVRRNFAEPFFQAFDFPNPHSTIGRRNVSNVPAQALALMNNPLVVEQCRVAAERLLAESSGDAIESRIERLYQLIYARPPHAEELTMACEFLSSQEATLGSKSDDLRIWSDYIHVLLNAKEFVFVR
ncbi:MAG: PSD1 and planctomycete cytochrome C domain-containing protein [Planctomycetaceae bacterium]